MSEFLKAFPSPEIIFNVPAQLPSYLPNLDPTLSCPPIHNLMPKR